MMSSSNSEPLVPVETKTTQTAYSFLQGNSEMSELIRRFDWKSTPLGAPAQWPRSLRTIVAMILSSRFPMFLWWGQDLIQFYNDRYLLHLGNEGKHPQALGQRGAECWPETWDIIYPIINQVLTTGEPTWNEDQLIPLYRNGSREDEYWTFSYSAVRDDADKIAGVLLVCQETTEKTLALKRLETSEHRFRNLIIHAPVGMCIVAGLPPVVEVVNDAFLELIGKTRQQLENRIYWDALPEAKEFYEPIVESVFHSGIPYFGKEQEVRLIRDGREELVHISFVLEPMKSLSGEIEKVMMVGIEVTDLVIARHKIEAIVTQRTRELAEANTNLQKSNAELAQFAYIASHDLQEPLRKICVFTDRLEESIAPITNPKALNYLHRINGASARMISLIRDVLKYSQLSKGNDDFKRVDLNEVLEGVRTDFELSIEQTGATIQTENPLPVVESIPLQMSQLLTNLVSNALKFRKPDTTPVISIRTSLHRSEEVAANPRLQGVPPYYKIEITDNGIGLPDEYAGQIFGIFQRLHGKAEYEGTGIGLAMCKRIVENHYGDIYARGSDSGSVFTVILPADHRANPTIEPMPDE